MRNLLGLVCLGGCFGSAVPYRFVSARLDRPADAYGAIVRILLEANYTLQSQDRASGVVVSEWYDVGVEMGVTRQHAWRLSVEGDLLSIAIDCREMPYDTWRACPQGTRDARWVAQAPILRDRVILATRHAGPPPAR